MNITHTLPQNYVDTFNGLAAGWLEDGGWEEQCKFGFAGSNSDGGRSLAADTGNKHEREQSFLLRKYLDSFIIDQLCWGRKEKAIFRII